MERYSNEAVCWLRAVSNPVESRCYIYREIYGFVSAMIYNLHDTTRAPTQANFATPVEEATGSKSNRTTNPCAHNHKRKRNEEVKRNSCSGKIDARRKIFCCEPLFPSHSVSRFSALSFCERGFLYRKVRKKSTWEFESCIKFLGNPRTKAVSYAKPLVSSLNCAIEKSRENFLRKFQCEEEKKVLKIKVTPKALALAYVINF